MSMPPKHLELACGTPVLVIGGISIWTTMLGCCKWAVLCTPEPGVGREQLFTCTTFQLNPLSRRVHLTSPDLYLYT